MSFEFQRLRQFVLSPGFKKGQSAEFSRLRAAHFAGISAANKLKLQQLAVKLVDWTKQNPRATAAQMENAFAIYASPMRPAGRGQNPQFTVSTVNVWVAHALLTALDGIGSGEPNSQSQMTSMVLQEAMDRRSKLVDTLSNLMKKIDDTSGSIVQNMK